MDFTDLGKHCHFCKQQDYLPIKCSNCKNYFCSKHSHNHSCPCVEDKQIITTRYKCSYEKCKNKNVSIDISCRHCKKRMCIFHRFPMDHKCLIYTKNIEYNKQKVMDTRLERYINNKPKIESTLSKINKQKKNKSCTIS